MDVCANGDPTDGAWSCPEPPAQSGSCSAYAWAKWPGTTRKDRESRAQWRSQLPPGHPDSYATEAQPAMAAVTERAVASDIFLSEEVVYGMLFEVVHERKQEAGTTPGEAWRLLEDDRSALRPYERKVLETYADALGLLPGVGLPVTAKTMQSNTCTDTHKQTYARLHRHPKV